MSRILFISTLEDLAGDEGEELWVQAAKILAQKHQVACSVHAWPELPPRIRALEKAGVKVIPRLRDERRAFRIANWFLPHALQCKAAEPMEHAIGMFHPDLVLISQTGNHDGFLPMDACARGNVPYANVVQCVPEGVSWPGDGEIQRQRPLFLGSRRLFFLSERNREFLETQYAVRFSNRSLVQNPLNVNELDRRGWPTSDTPLRLACVARLELCAKGQDMLLDVLSLPKWRERALTIDLFSKGPNEWILREQIRRLNLANLTVCDPPEKAASIWDNHHALILPSRQEGMPRALAEAFLCGRPAIVTRVGGNAEWVEEGVNGFIAAAPAMELVDQALERLWENRTRLPDMGANARKAAEQKISPRVVEDFVGELSLCLPHN